MKGLNTKELIGDLIKYDFYNWDETEENDNYILKLGMPQRIFDKYHVNDFYHSWGFEAVNNEYADPSITPELWLAIEDEFFEWLKSAANILFPQEKVIVTPSLERIWFPFETYPPDWTIENSWMKQDYEKYISLLTESDILSNVPSSREDYRGGLVENYDEIRILGKIAAKSQRLLFFSNRDNVITITDYLSIIVESKDETTFEHVRMELKQLLEPQFLD